MKNIEVYYSEIFNTFNQGININCAIKAKRCPKDELFRCDGHCLVCEKNNFEWLNKETDVKPQNGLHN